MSEGAAASCPHCGLPLRERQRWCLACGAAAMTAVATTHHWRSVALATAIAAAALLAAIGYAAAALTS